MKRILWAHANFLAAIVAVILLSAGGPLDAFTGGLIIGVIAFKADLERR